MSARHQPDPVQPALRQAEAKVARHLEEACDEIGQKDLGQESLDELLRLENELLAAAQAVDETVRLRRQLGERPTSGAESLGSPAAATSMHPDKAPACRLREFRDTEGKEWRAWEVRPGSSGRRIDPEQYLGEYVKGWVAFECLRDETRKRLPNPPPEWSAMPDADLERLLPRAVEVTKRGSKARGATPG